MDLNELMIQEIQINRSYFCSIFNFPQSVENISPTPCHGLKKSQNTTGKNAREKVKMEIEMKRHCLNLKTIIHS